MGDALIDYVSSEAVLPWQATNWQRLMAARQSGRMPHALLLTGGLGLGKSWFAHRLAAALLCTEPQAEGRPCGSCQGCRLLRAGTHPDFTWIQPEEPGKAIKIDAVREFTQKEGLTSRSGGYKIIIIEPADALNTAAANSLLKTLEEPVERTVMVLVTANAGRLPATIRSRCQRYHFTSPEPTIAQSWLAEQIPDSAHIPLLLSLASGAPVLALNYARDGILEERARVLDDLVGILKGGDPIAVAERWSKLEQLSLINWFSGWVIDLIRLRMAPESAHIMNVDQRDRLHALARKVNSKKLYALLDQILEANRTLGAQLNTQMQLESLLLNWAGIGVE